MRDHAIYYLLYPNLSEQVIFGASGDVITIKGDARNLKSVEVKGSQSNEELTAFRLENKDKGFPGTREAAAAFIAQSPSSPVKCFFILRSIFCPMTMFHKDVKTLSCIVQGSA